MNNFQSINVREWTPILSLLVECDAHSELLFRCTESYSEKDLEDSVSLVLNDFQPKLVAKEHCNGVREFISGGLFIRCMIDFVAGRVPYPQNGAVKELQGKYFSDLERLRQRQFREARLRISFQDISRASEEEQDLFEILTQTAIKLSS